MCPECVSGIAIAAVAIVIATPSALQRLFGDAKLFVGFDQEEQGYDRVLLGRIRNQPIRNRVARLLGVRREPAQDVVARVTIKEAGSHRIVVPATIATIATHGDIEAKRVTVPASLIASTFDIVKWVDTSNNVQELLKNNQVVASGQYTVEVAVSFSRKTVTTEKDFTVGLTRDDLNLVLKPCS